MTFVSLLTRFITSVGKSPFPVVRHVLVSWTAVPSSTIYTPMYVLSSKRKQEN